MEPRVRATNSEEGSRTPNQLRRRRPPRRWLFPEGWSEIHQPAQQTSPARDGEPRPCIGFSLASSLCDFVSGSNEAGGSPGAPVPAFGPRQTVPRPALTPHLRCCFIGAIHAFTPVVLVSVQRSSQLRRPKPLRLSRAGSRQHKNHQNVLFFT